MLAALALAAALTGVDAQGKPGTSETAEQMLLRLHELPRQYGIGDDSGCGGYGTENAPPVLTEWVIERRPAGCEFEYGRLFPLPGRRDDPPIVSTVAITVRSDRAAEEGFAIAPELLGYTTGDRYAELPAAATVGDASKRLRTDDANVFGKVGKPASALFWRTGKTLAAIYVAGVPHGAGDRIALRLARVQQRHITRPTPYTEAQQDWTTVPLENPAIRFPVHWLGRTFKPGRGLPPTSLYDAYLPIGRGGGPTAQRAMLNYEDFSLGIWTRAGWNLYEESVFGPLVSGWRCTEMTSLKLARGRAIIYAGYPQDFDICPDQAPTVFTAEVHLGKTVIGINRPNCIPCPEVNRSRYASVRALEAVARGLRLRRGRVAN